MGLRLRTVAPTRGQAWLREGFRIFFRHPLGFAALFVAYLMLVSLLGWVPWVGSVLAAATVPLLSLAFMLATHEALQGRPVGLGTLFALWREPPATRRTMLLLCGVFGVAMTLIVELALWLGGDELVQALKPLSQTEVTTQDMMGVLASAPVSRLINWITGLSALLAVPYWHALALVHWGGQSAGQALFSSTLALWRTKGAVALYLLSWLGCIVLGSLAAGLGTALLAALAGAGPFALALAVSVMLGLSSAFYASLWFMFADSFGATEAPTAAAPADATPP